MPDVLFDAEKHEYIVDGRKVPSVTTILSHLNRFGEIPMEILHNAALRGTEIHRLTEQFDRGIEEDTDEKHAPYVRAWIQFRRDTGFKPLAIEERLFHPEEFYCGTLDRVGILDGHHLAVIDIKSSVNLSPVTGLQLAAYQAAWNYHRPDQATTKRYAVRVGKDGSYEVREYSDWDDYANFLAALALFNWQARVGSR